MHVGVSPVIVVVVTFIVMVVVNLIVMVALFLLVPVAAFFNPLMMMLSCGGDWRVDVLSFISHGLVVGVVSCVSYWLPVDVGLGMIDWLILCLRGEILVLCLGSVMVRRLIAVL